MIVAQDAAGNANNAAAQFSIVSNRTAPVPVISSTESDPTNAAPISMSVDFGEVVNDFVQGGAGITFDVGTSPPPGQTKFTDLALGAGVEYPKLGWDGTNLLVRIGPNTYVISYVLGGTGKWKQRYMTTIDNQEYISPVQYNDVTRE